MAKSHGQILLVILMSAVVYLAGNPSVGLWDRDEARYAQCSRQMLQSGDWVVPRLYDEVRANKPPLIYWCQAAAMRFIGEGPASAAFAARLPSAIAMLATLAIIAIAVRRHAGEEQALWTVFVLCSSLMTIVAAKLALTDSVLLLFGTIAQLSVYAIWRGNRSWTPVVLLAVALGLGAMTKPLILLTVGATVAVLLVFRFTGQRPLRAAAAIPGRPAGKTILQILAGVAIIAIIAGPWLWLVYHRAPEFLGKMTAEGRAHLETGKEGHSLPPGYHLALIWITFFPWSLLLPLAVGLGIRYRREPQVRFALAAVIGPWLVLEFFGTKLPHYILAAFPALAYLTAHAIVRSLRGEAQDMRSRPFLIGAAAWSAAAAAMGLVLWLPTPAFRFPGLHFPTFPNQPYGVIGFLSLGAAVYGASVFLLLKRGKLAGAVSVAGSGIMLLFLLTYTLYLPRAQFFRVSIRAGEVLERVGATHRGDVAMIDYKEPSLGFYQGGTIREQKKSFLETGHWHEWPRWMVVTREAWDAAPPESRARLSIVSDPANPVRGWSYAEGLRSVELIVVEQKAR